jgi:cytochrome c-type biogenesis protein
MTEVSIAAAVAAGLVSFISPCVLALLPVYLAFLGEASTTDARLVAGPDATLAGRAAVLPQALLFIVGFGVVFIVVGTAIGLIGLPLFRIPEARQAAGLAVIALGILTTGVFGPVLDRVRLDIGSEHLPAGRSVRSLALGAFVAVGWTPCIGPVLGAIFTMGASSGSAPVVALLLTAYTIGLAVPFMAAALAFHRLRPVTQVLRRHHRLVRVASGALIIGIGVLIFQNAFARLATLFTVPL